ncbi:putative Fatty acid synthase alpha subunit hexA [Seiridium cardinale]|uniref:beta-ketoacyl-[acyl-carrier-protein] synthase I n=1 Tax=Seiridium cardinale TaxID=138064 RepID=A0ABR2Y4Q9_9PEZI
MAKTDMDDKSIAYELLVELLAHQFAFPVQWIETQKTLMSGHRSVSRMVELGPAKTLSGMGQKTAQRQVSSGERSADATIQFLASTQSAKELLYQYDAVVSQEEEAMVEEPAAKVVVTSQQPSAKAGPQAVAVSTTTAAIPDAPLQSTDCIRILVARKLKKPIHEISASKSIKELCGGKSTLQNELVGDFSEEFAGFPDRAEDAPLQDLGIVLGTMQKLGKTSATLVSRLIASKMPSKFSKRASIESYLADKWSLGPLRQMSALLHAVASEPPSRIASTEGAETYWDQVVSEYAQLGGISLQARSLKVDIEIQAAVNINPAALNEVTQSHRRMANKQYEALAEYLQYENANNTESELERQVDELQNQLDDWTAEFSQAFLPGIETKFDADKIRRYRSWWNNARQQLLAFHQGTSLDKLVHDESLLGSFISGLCNRADPQLVAVADQLALEYSDVNSSQSQVAARIAHEIASSIHVPPVARPILPAMGPRTTICEDGSIKYSHVPRKELPEAATYVDFLSKHLATQSGDGSSAISLQYCSSSSAKRSEDLTSRLLQAMLEAVDCGVSFVDKVVLITGAGPNSIGSELIRLLLSGGACVIVTTHREPSTTAKYFQSLYETFGAKDSELYLVPFNQASARDCEKLIDHIYGSKGLHKDLDAIIPFAASPEDGIEMNEVGAESELAHRMMLVNVYRLLGGIVKNKRNLSIDCNPTQVLLPLSPNHGIFGGDGLYPESKIGLETLLNRVKSESWSNELSICGVRIGWTRSTGLMAVNDVVAETVEKQGVLTFSAPEMAFNMAMLLTPEFVNLCEECPVHADFGGRLGIQNDDFSKLLTDSRQEINLASSIAKAIKLQDDHENAALASDKQSPNPPHSRKAMLRVGYPHLPEFTTAKSVLGLPLNTPAETVVVVGFSELGPWGSSRTRWEIEHQGRLSVEGYVEMAWLMNLIKHFEGAGKDGSYYIGWVDTKTGDPIADVEVEQKYGEYINMHAGIRFSAASEETGFETPKKDLLQEIVVEDDLPAFETSLATADALRSKHGDRVSIERLPGSEGVCRVRIRRGATILVPKTVPAPWASVAGRMPDGWSASRYGIPDDIAKQVDPVTLYTICCVAEAFHSAGIADPLEVFEYMHLSEFGSFIGSSMGGVVKTRHLYRDTYLDQEIQADTLQDTYLNTTAAWVNMLLLGATGPIKTPVGACATGVESIDSGFESIMAGKTKMCIVGGYDDIQEEESFGFSKMKATANVASELARGRVPSEMSRPTAESRAGFVESHGCGVQILCRGDIALEMGLPIYGIIAGSTMAADKIGRSVPAPGKGILTFAKERRNEQAMSTNVSVDGSLDTESDYYAPLMPANGLLHSSPAPLRAALAAWGLTVDDLDVASLHGTSTQANDLNEPDVICRQMSHLGRTSGRPMWAICQKSVTGHPKAPAAAWMLNGCLQVLDTGIIPGNRNADSVDMRLREKHHLCFPTNTVQTKEGVRAFLLTSFGFGQKSGQVVGVAPRYFFASLRPAQYQEYSKKTKARQARADRAYVKAMMTNRIVQIKEKPPYDEDDTPRIFLDPASRISKDMVAGEYRFEPDV